MMRQANGVAVIYVSQVNGRVGSVGAEASIAEVFHHLELVTVVARDDLAALVAERDGIRRGQQDWIEKSVSFTRALDDLIKYHEFDRHVPRSALADLLRQYRTGGTVEFRTGIAALPRVEITGLGPDGSVKP